MFRVVVFSVCLCVTLAVDLEICNKLRDESSDLFDKNNEVQRLCDLHQAAISVAEVYEEQIMLQLANQPATLSASKASSSMQKDAAKDLQEQHLQQPGADKRGNEFMRFGRGNEFMRFGKRGNEFMRFGRGNEFMRFGKRGNEFMRFGKRDSENDGVEAAH